jgi:hypothetical protein
MDECYFIAGGENDGEAQVNAVQQSIPAPLCQWLLCN